MKTFISFLIIATSLYAHSELVKNLSDLHRNYTNELNKTSDSWAQDRLKRILAFVELFRDEGGYPVFKEYVPTAAIVFRKLNQKEKQAFIREMENCFYSANNDIIKKYDEGNVIEHALKMQIDIINKYAKKVL